jgi:hypothetical protein
MAKRRARNYLRRQRPIQDRSVLPPLLADLAQVCASRCMSRASADMTALSRDCQPRRDRDPSGAALRPPCTFTPLSVCAASLARAGPDRCHPVVRRGGRCHGPVRADRFRDLSRTGWADRQVRAPADPAADGRRVHAGAGLPGYREKIHFLNPVPIRLVHDRWVSKYAEPWAAALNRARRRLLPPDRHPRRAARGRERPALRRLADDPLRPEDVA